MEDYWNHNSAYHPRLVQIASQQCGDVLDVGCGEGLLTQRMAPVSRSVTGLDPDHQAIERARARLASVDNAGVETTACDEYRAGRKQFDLITFVASIHHMNLRESLLKARQLLTPSGEIVVVGLSANRTVADWAWSAASFPAVQLASRLHHEIRDVGVLVADPDESLREIRRTAREVLPGAAVRRGLYYRYLLRWRDRNE